MRVLPTLLPALRLSLATASLSRALALLVGLGAVVTVGFPESDTIPRPPSASVVVSLPARWDTGWYVGLASGHYRWDGQPGRFENIAFFPAYPLLLQGVATAVGAHTDSQWNWTGAALSTVLYALALMVLWEMARGLAGESRARWCVVLCASYPFAVFFGLPYSESLFLLAVAAAFHWYQRKWYAAALIAGIVTGLTRPTGVVVTLAMSITWATRFLQDPAKRGWSSDAAIGAIAAAGPLLGNGIYSAFVYGLTGHPWMWATVQDGWGRPAQNPLGAVWVQVSALAAHPALVLWERPHDVLNTAAAAFALGLVVPVSRRLGLDFGMFVLAGTVMPLAGGGIASLGRYTSVLFPIYLWLAVATPPRVLWLVVTVFIALQVVVATLFFTWRPLY